MVESTPATAPAADAASEPTRYEQLRVVPWSLAYDLANTFFVNLTFFGSVFILFLNDLKLNTSQIGILLSLMPFLSLLSLFITRPVARAGYRRTFLVSMAIRTAFAGGLFLVPFVEARFGIGSAIGLVWFVTVAFSISRAVAMTAFLPWQQEYIPPALRGRVSGYSSIIVSLAGLVAAAVAGFLIDRPLGAWRYPSLFGIAVLFGLFSILIATRFPGGAPFRRGASLFRIDSKILQPLRDPRFVRYLVILCLIALAIGPIYSFLPLFMKEKVGLGSGSIVLLATGSLIGSLLSSYFWGWLADRYGSKPISLTGLLLTGLLPILWFVMPRGSPVSFAIALAISFVQGIASTGWSIGSGRLLFVSIVSNENRTEYLSQYNAWTGLLSGIGSIMGGALLQAFASLRSSLFSLSIDAYAILFALGVLTVLVCTVLMYSLHTASEAGLGQFAGLFFHGNALMAISSMIRFYNARDESQVVQAAQRLALAHSPLTVDELISLVNDPRFYVRFEAIVSMTRHSADERLLQALIEVMEAPDPALSTLAAWAIARFRNAKARPALRHVLETSPYRSVQIQASRALASLGDRSIIPWLKEHLRHADDWGVKVAAASGLGKLKVYDETPQLLALLRDLPLQSRGEVGLSMARLLGAEARYIQLSRAFSQDLGTALAQEMETLRARLRRSSPNPDAMAADLIAARDEFSRDNLEAGFAPYLRVVATMASSQIPIYCRQMLAECADRMREFGPSRLEYALIAALAIERCGK